jgi:hypothetical protein
MTISFFCSMLLSYRTTLSEISLLPSIDFANDISELIYPRGIPLNSRTEDGVPRPSQFGIPTTHWEDTRIETSDGETLACYYLRPEVPSKLRKTTVLMFHGNAGNIGHRVPIAQAIGRSNGCAVLMAEYRGYGLSTGTPDEKGLKLDAQSCLDWIRDHPETRDSNIVVFGHQKDDSFCLSTCKISCPAVSSDMVVRDGLTIDNRRSHLVHQRPAR